MRNHLMKDHFKFRPWRCKLCPKGYIQSDALSMHIAITHLKLVKNGPEYWAKHKELKSLTLEHKEKVPFKMVDDTTAVCGEVLQIKTEEGPTAANDNDEERVKKAVESITVLSQEG